MGLSLQILLKNYELVLMIYGQEIVLKGNNGASMERDLNKYCIVEDGRT